MMNHVNILLDLFIVLIVSTLTLQVMSKWINLWNFLAIK
jgi:hypothetical protein